MARLLLKNGNPVAMEMIISYRAFCACTEDGAVSKIWLWHAHIQCVVMMRARGPGDNWAGKSCCFVGFLEDRWCELSVIAMMGARAPSLQRYGPWCGQKLAMMGARTPSRQCYDPWCGQMLAMMGARAHSLQCYGPLMWSNIILMKEVGWEYSPDADVHRCRGRYTVLNSWPLP